MQQAFSYAALNLQYCPQKVFFHAPIFMDAADGAAKMMNTSSFHIIGEKFIYPIDSSPGICDDMCNLLLSDLEAT
ncbi:hypothetical protein CDAR_1991 [Caerostris darwini]|uniref:Uncharacterized protein n=1 Tax=Caerostris darwini TaxID=1538125 RepID=A0AAV4R7U9_9ARAC|nr:hypothetical protein CDAR_1991 [Caerostris darwini]